MFLKICNHIEYFTANFPFPKQIFKDVTDFDCKIYPNSIKPKIYQELRISDKTIFQK